MAKVKIAGVIQHLDYQLKKALEEAVSEVAPSTQIDKGMIHQAFKRIIERKVEAWVTVPDQLIKEWKGTS